MVNYGQERYSREQKALSEAYSAYVRRVGRHVSISYRDWITTDEGRRVRLRARDQFYADFPDAPRVSNSTIQPVTSTPNKGRSSKRNTDSVDPSEPDPSRPRTASPPLDRTVSLPDLANISPSDFDISDLPADIPTPDTSAQFSRTLDSMASTSNPIATPLAADAPGQSVGSGGGPAVGATGEVIFPQSYYSSSGRQAFTKQRIMFSYAYANAQLASLNSSNSNIQCLTTPLSFIPVDFLPFYLSPAEFDQLPIGSRVDFVQCTVKLLGVRSAFNTGTSEAGVATSEYCPLLLTATGLNHSTTVNNLQVKAHTNMVPTEVENISPKTMIDKWYTSNTASVNCVPRSNSNFACIISQKDQGTAAKREKTNSSSGGNFRLDTVVETSLLTSRVGQNVLQYSYEPKAGYIKGFKTPIINDQQLGSANMCMPNRIPMKATFQPASTDAQNVKTLSHFNLAGSSIPPYRIWPSASTNFNYSQTIEHASVFNPMSGEHVPVRAQPQLHIGMAAVPQLDPATELTTFMNACVYYSVTCQIGISYDTSTPCTSGPPACLPHNALWTHNPNKYYGYTDEVLGFGTYSQLFSDTTLKQFSRLASEVDAEPLRQRIERLQLHRQSVPTAEDSSKDNDEQELDELEYELLDV